MTQTESLRHHNKFYMDSDMVTILVDDCLFRVPKRYLQQHSDAFASMFALPQPTLQGQSDETPIRLDGAPLEEFEALLDMIYTHELGHQSSNHSGLTRLAAATRWNSPTFRQQALIELAGSNDAVAQLVASHRFGVPEWRWPALFVLCIREGHVKKEDILQLTPEDLLTLMAVRETLFKENITDIFKKERRLRDLLREHEPSLAEPISSPLSGPRSGYQSRFFDNVPYPPGALSLDAPFVDTDGSAVYVGSAVLGDNIIIPCKVVVRNSRPRAYVEYYGEKVVDDFSILHVDSSRMKWVPVQEMRSAEHRAIRPVEAGLDENHPKLYYAYAEINGMKVPGQAHPAFSYAYFALGLGQCDGRDSDFFILAWR
jgi:hypothetical protein